MAPLERWVSLEVPLRRGGDIRRLTIGHFTVVYLVDKPLIWSEAKSDLVVMETSMITK